MTDRLREAREHVVRVREKAPAGGEVRRRWDRWPISKLALSLE